MNNLPKRIFLTGIPGSRWSGVASHIQSVPGMNTTDRRTSREYHHHLFSGHDGVYYGRGMEFEALDILDQPSELDKAWGDPSAGCQIMKSHDWAYDLNRVRQLYPDDWIMLVYRPSVNSLDWWLEAGGFSITYPSYASYQDPVTMRKEIEIQNTKILEFSQAHDLNWDHFGTRWVTENIGTTEPFETFSRDILVAILK
jgi:hypothetical protein